MSTEFAQAARIVDDTDFHATAAWTSDLKTTHDEEMKLDGVMIRAGVAVAAKRLLMDTSIGKEDALEAIISGMLEALEGHCGTVEHMGHIYFHTDGQAEADKAWRGDIEAEPPEHLKAMHEWRARK